MCKKGDMGIIEMRGFFKRANLLLSNVSTSPFLHEPEE